MYKVVYTKTAAKDVPKLKSAHLDEKAKALIEIIRVDPFQNPPPYEKLVGDLNGAYSRRINLQHRLVYQIYEEEKTIKLYDSEAKKELPKAVPMLVEALGLEVSLGIVKVLENKNEKQGDEYVPTAETRELNATDKVFHTETRMTVVEAREGAEVAKFWDSWLERNKGNTRDKRTIKDGQAGTAGAPKAAGASAAAPAAGGAPRKSLFGK